MNSTSTKRLVSLTVAFLLTTAGALHAQTIVLQEPLEDATGNNLTVLGNDLTNSLVIPGFNYATGDVGAGVAGGPFPAGIPEAPNTQPGDAPRTGLLIAANTSAALANEVMALVHDPNNPAELFTVTGDYDLQLDVWMNYEIGGPGTTENGGVFIGHDGSQTVRPNGAGFNFTGDGGFAGDYILFKGTHPASAGDEGQFWAGRVLSEEPGGQQYDQALFDAHFEAFETDFRVNTNGNPLLSRTFCSTDCSENPNGFSDYDVGLAFDPQDAQGDNQVGTIDDGAGGFRWMTIKMEVRPNSPGPAGVTDDLGFATVSLVSHQQSFESIVFGDPNFGVPLDPQPDPIELVIGVIDNSAGDTVVDMTGAVGLWYIDFFASLNTSGFQFGVFDNLIITQVEAPALEGDFNGDGVVDAADYTVWRDGLGTEFEAADYDQWKANFGATAPGAAVGAAVPEPSSLVLWLLAAAGLLARRRGR